MTGQTILAALGIALGVFLLVWLWLRGERLEHELERLRSEYRVWGVPGEWRCSCNPPLRFDRRSTVRDGRGMLHGVYRCEPDLQMFGDDVS